ncbi:MAG: ABC transporter permease [Chlamydiia bacterium]|nr:ABC transporter permease [Chlamydiia bacterium]
MRFEFGLARKYLVPRRGQLSVSLICLLSIFVITLVVWLLVTFLSVMGGIEKNWLHKLTSLNAPLKINPTHRYFNSYYYQVDAISSASNYSLKTIGEKKVAPLTNPYNEEIDTTVPMEWERTDHDLVKDLFTAINEIDEPGLIAQEYDISGALLRLKLVRGDYHSFLSQVAYVASYADQSPQVQALLEEKTDLSIDESGATGVLLPRAFKDQGVTIGDRGFLGYGGSGAASGQEMRLDIRVAGFYDPGVMSIGPKCVLAPAHIAGILRTSGDAYTLDPCQSTGVQVWFSNLDHTRDVEAKLQAKLSERGLSDYWSVTSYYNYDFAKDLLQQFKSDKLLFTLIGMIILIVAASNIISSLVLLVNNKKKEIGILQSMGASKKSIALIFAICGLMIGVISTCVGAAAAVLTLHNIDHVVHFLSWVQGHDAFNALFYGNSLPSTLSTSSIKFIAIATPAISLIAALIPALKACRMQPAQILRSE